MCKEVEKLVNEKSEIRYAEGTINGKAESVFNLMHSSGMDFKAAVNILCYSEIATELKPIVDAMLEAENAGE